MLLLLLNLAAAGSGINGTGTIADGADTPAGIGTVSVAGAGAAGDGGEVVSGSGGGVNGVSGTGNIVDGADQVAGTGTFPGGVSSLEPISLAEVKEYLGLFTSDRDTTIPGMITRARLWVEDHTGLAIVQRQFVERHLPSRYGVMRLNKGPLVSVDSVDYLDSSGSAGTLTPTAYPPNGELFAAGGWPSLVSNEKFTVTYTAGEDSADIDDRLKGAMFALIEGEFSEGYAYPQRAVDAAERCCSFLTQMVA
jgi:uncharacterized phiE125 gp8 family phage protein